MFGGKWVINQVLFSSKVLISVAITLHHYGYLIACLKEVGSTWEDTYKTKALYEGYNLENEKIEDIG